MPTVLQINTVVNSGSTGRIAEEVGQLAMQNGWQSVIAYGRGPGQSRSELIRIGTDWGVRRHVLQTRLLDNHGLASARATGRLVRQIRQIAPDVIHLHNLHGYYLHFEILFDYLKQAGIPVIWTLHDCWAFTGHCAYYDFVECSRWQQQCHHCPQKAIYPKSILLDRSRQNYRQKKETFTGLENVTLITPSQWLAGEVRRSFLQDYPVKVIPNGINLDVFRPTESRFRRDHHLEDKFVLLGVAARWIDRKGYGHFHQLAHRLKPDERLVLVGVDKKQKKALPPQIIGIERTHNTTELAALYSMADVLINPTLEEVQGLVNIESLACGTPVITFNSGGSPECIDDDCGLVVERGNLAGLVDAIGVIKKKDKAAYTAQCQKRARELFDKTARFSEYMKLYQKHV